MIYKTRLTTTLLVAAPGENRLHEPAETRFQPTAKNAIRLGRRIRDLILPESPDQQQNRGRPIFLIIWLARNRSKKSN